MFKKMKISILLLLVTMYLLVTGCAGVNTFSPTVRAGDTFAFAAGWRHNFKHDNITVRLTPPGGAFVEYLPGDPAVRAIINLYPDPLSWIVVGTETDQGLGDPAFKNAADYGIQINNTFTGQDPDWWQTTIFIDMPTTLADGSTPWPLGDTDVLVYAYTPDIEYTRSNVEVIDAGGSPDTFDAESNGPMSPIQLASMERMDHFVVTFDGVEIPYAIQVEFSHNPDAANAGVGVPYVVNPRGDIKNVTWSDDGISMKAIVIPAQGQVLDNMVDFKFYVAGGITGLILVDVQAFDINGSTVAGVAADITPMATNSL